MLLVLLQILGGIGSITMNKNKDPLMITGSVLLLVAAIAQTLFFGKMMCQMKSTYFWSIFAMSVLGTVLIAVSGGAQLNNQEPFDPDDDK